MIKNWYTDGSCRGNPGPGGWGAISIDNDEAIWLSGREERTTNNRMELQAILKICEIASKDSLNEYVIYTDSAYCVDCINSWMWSWSKNDWKLTGKTQSVDNLDLIQPLFQYFNTPFFNVAVRKVPGHANVLGNELADRLATGKMEEFADLLKENNIIQKLELKIKEEIPIKTTSDKKQETWVDFF